MKSLKVKLVSVVSAFILALSLLIIGVWAVGEAQHINLSGSVKFTISNDTLYIKDIRVRDTGDLTGQGTTIENFIPGFVNGDIDINLGTLSADTSFSLLFDVINTSTTTYQASTNSIIDNAVISAGGIINGDGIAPSEITADTAPSGTIVLTVTASSAGLVTLDGIVITIDEYVPVNTAAAYVNTVTIANGDSQNTISTYNGEKQPTDVLDLSTIEFATGETTLTISMTSLSAKYIKNNVSWVNTSGVTISSTSLYLPQNPSEQLTGGESRDLKIYVNNTSGSTTTISGLEVEFEEKEDLLQVTEEEETSTYTEEGYWYVEMGTYSTTTDNSEGKRESEYLRWRYFSDTTKHYDFNRAERPTGDGYFILESYYYSYLSINIGGLYCSWNNDYTYRSETDATHHNYNGWNNIDANDYSTSTIRQYINGNEVQKSYSGSWDTTVTPANPSSNMFTDLHIDPENDIIYTDIIGRTLGDLYTDMSESGTNPQDVDFPKGSPNDWTGATITYSKEDTDKFWLLSYYEAYHMLGADTSSPTTDREWGDLYWLRSPSSSGSGDAYFVDSPGDFNISNVGENVISARAAFKFSI